MPSPVGGIDSIRDDQMIHLSITEYRNGYKRKYQNEYLTLSALGDGGNNDCDPIFDQSGLCNVFKLFER